MPGLNERRNNMPEPGRKNKLHSADPLATLLSKQALVNDAKAARVIWARVKGYPWWPAQILSKAAARQHLGGVTHKSKSDAPVIFFGTSEIAWIGAKDVTCWESGMAQSFHNKGRKNKKFVVALDQVRDFLSLTAERAAPGGWWCAPPARGARAATEEPASSDDEPEPAAQQQQQQHALVAASTIQQPATVAQPDQLKQLAGLQAEQHGSFVSGSSREGGGGGSFTAAAVAAALSAEGATATAAVVLNRSLSGLNRHSSGRLDDSVVHHSSFSSRSAGTHKSACQQIWGGGGGSMSGNPGLDLVGEQQQEQLGRHQRKRRATRLLYDTSSEASESEGSETAAARARPAAAAGRASTKRNGSRSRGTAAIAAAAAAAAAAAVAADDEELEPPTFLVSKKQRLLQAEGDAGGSDSEATDMESLAMAALAMAQLANGGSWDHTAQGPQQAADVVQEQQPAAPSADEVAADVAAGISDAEQAFAVAADMVCKSEAAAAAEFMDVEAEPPCDSMTVAAGYLHGGQGLPCPHSWQYAVAMPGAAVPAVAGADAGTDAAGSSTCMLDDSSREGQQSAVPPVAACPRSMYYMQLFAGLTVGGASADDVEGQQLGVLEEAVVMEQQEAAFGAADGQAAVMDAAATAAAGCNEFNTELGPAARLHAPASAAAAAAEVPPGAAAVSMDEQNAAPAGSLLTAGVLPQAQGCAVPAVAAGTASHLEGSEGMPQRSSAELQQHIAAANAAISAAFTASAPAGAAALGHVGPYTQRHHHSHSLPYQHNSSSAAVSDRSAGSAGPRAGASGSISSKRRNAAAAAALAAAHVITPPNPPLDAEVANLLLQPSGPVLPMRTGLADTGFRLPRELLMNRPPKFEWLKRNIFVSRERPKRLAKNEVHVCNCRPKRVRQPDGSDLLVGCTEHCLNRLSFIHCDPRTCPCGAACTNKPFHALKAPPLEVFLTENRGHGVRLTQQLEKGQFVVEYAGEVIDQAELQRRMDAARDSGEQHFYIMELAPGLYIDAKRKGNHARLLNSSCDPNCETQKWRDAATGEVRIGIFTTRPVVELEELTYDYMFEHSGVGALAHGFKCMCGAKNCRGTMDVNPDRKRDWGRRLEVFWEGDGVYYRGTVTGYSTSSGKHTIMYDDGDVERVKLTEVSHHWLDGDASPHSSAQAAAEPSALNTVIAAAAGDSGSWSQTDQEAGADDGSGPTAPAGQAIGLRMGRPALGASPLRPTSAAAAAAGAAGADDAVVAADALVTLGLAAEAELEQQQQLLPPQVNQQVQEQEMYAPPVAKKQRRGLQFSQAEQARYDGVLQQQQYMHPGLSRAQQQWQHSSSSSQSAGGHYGVGGVVDGQSPISPPGQRGFQPFRPPSNLGPGALPPSAGGWPTQQQQFQRQQQQPPLLQQQQKAGVSGRQTGARMAAEPDSQGEFLPWEQLLSGIRAIKTQGPPLFQKSSSNAVPAQQQQQHLGQVHAKQSYAAAFGSCASRFGRLLDLVGQVQPEVQETVLQQQLQPPQQLPLAQAGRSGSWGGSSTSSSVSCQLPLFRAVDAQMSALLLLQQQQQQQPLSLQPQPARLVSPRSREAQSQQQQQQQHWPQLPPMHPHHPQQHKQAAQQQARSAAPPAVPGPPAIAPVPLPAVTGPQQPAQPAAAAAGGAGANGTRGPATSFGSTLQAERANTPASVMPAQRSAAASEPPPPVADCVRYALPDADSRAAAAAAAAVVQACCAGQAAVLGSAGSGGSTASADSALATAAAAVAAVPTMQAAGMVDMRQPQAVAQ